jgi:outer membrane protein OmpU
MTETEGKIMKKILIATTALVATAGVAAADVSLSGYARFGLQYTNLDGGESSTDVRSRLRIQADASTTTDAGVGLNVRTRFQIEENATNDSNGARFGLTYEGISVNFGNINGAVASAPGLYMGTQSGGVGLEGNSFSNVAPNNAGGTWAYTEYSSGGAGATNGMEVIYSSNGLGLHVHTTDGSTGIGANYTVSNITVAVAREDFDNGNEVTFASAGLGIGNGNVTVSWAETNGVAKAVLAGAYDMAPGARMLAFVGSEDAGESYGVGAQYDLGGGASFHAGVDSNVAGDSRVSAGLFFSF